MAADKEWDSLKDYCAEDVRILCDIYRLRMITHPRTKATFDLADISEPMMYADKAQVSLSQLHNTLTELDKTKAQLAVFHKELCTVYVI